jgi:hypothetical protein
MLEETDELYLDGDWGFDYVSSPMQYGYGGRVLPTRAAFPDPVPDVKLEGPQELVGTPAGDEFSDKIQRAVVNLLTTKDLRSLSAAPQTQRATKAMYGFGLRGEPREPHHGMPTVYNALASKSLNVVGRDKAVWALVTVSSAPPSSTLNPDDPDTVIDEHGICYQGELDGKRGRKRQRRACFSVRVD